MQTAAKYTAKENEFLNKLYDGVTEEQVKNAYYFLTKLEDNLKSITEEIIK